MFELLAMRGKADPGMMRWIALYERGMKAFYHRDWDTTIRLFSSVSELRGGHDPVSAVQIERALAFRAAAPPVEWEGISVRTTQ